jgi:hypothetical protein
METRAQQLHRDRRTLAVIVGVFGFIFWIPWPAGPAPCQAVSLL